MNRDGNRLPFGYYNPLSEGKITWHCSYGSSAETNIVSVFLYKGEEGEDRRDAVLENIEQAIYMKDELVKEGWMPIVPPKVIFRQENGELGTLTRKQKRRLQREVEKIK